MKVYSQSFAEKGSSPKLRALLKAEGEMEAAITRLERVAQGKLDLPKAEGGFFGFGGGEDSGPDPYAVSLLAKSVDSGRGGMGSNWRASLIEPPLTYTNTGKESIGYGPSFVCRC